MAGPVSLYIFDEHIWVNTKYYRYFFLIYPRDLPYFFVFSGCMNEQFQPQEAHLFFENSIQIHIFSCWFINYRICPRSPKPFGHVQLLNSFVRLWFICLSLLKHLEHLLFSMCSSMLSLIPKILRSRTVFVV